MLLTTCRCDCLLRCCHYRRRLDLQAELPTLGGLFNSVSKWPSEPAATEENAALIWALDWKLQTKTVILVAKMIYFLCQKLCFSKFYSCGFFLNNVKWTEGYSSIIMNINTSVCRFAFFDMRFLDIRFILGGFLFIFPFTQLFSW